MTLYKPQEDSHLLKKAVIEQAFGEVLDMGTGSGILAEAALENNNVANVLAVDIDDETIDYLKKNIDNRRITILQSDLFKKVNESFDTIIFNPPYLPQDPKDKHQALYGGKEGYELTLRFLKEAREHLKPGGIILLLFSSLTNKDRLEIEMKRDDYHFKELYMEAHFFERLYVYKLWRE